MRSLALLFLIGLLLAAGCAPQGVIVRKDFRPLPFEYSLGGPGIFRFEVRDRAGRIQRQMVSETVFARYEVGDYFDPSQPPPSFRFTAPALRSPPVNLPPPLQETGTRFRK